MSTVIKVENLGKQYRLGEVGTGTLSHDLNRWWARMRGKEDPFAKIGETNDRTQKGVSEYVWALQDINFEVKAGEVLGIIGRNGAGKSTLLKILSKVTKPSTGQIKTRGRIASLLEVGTGFHPEMTGRENVFLNGAIMGMTKNEIKRKFDEIVDFAGVERYIDTPVKRYSSGMYVRLAFAVAAHLEPEILIVDEVLAVGDAEFQKKCLGKMKDVSVNDGRTVLFVSHNMAAVQNLCNTSVLLTQGKIEVIGKTENIIGDYLVLKKNAYNIISDIKERNGNGSLRFINARVIDNKSNIDNNVESFSTIQIELQFISSSDKINTSRIDIGINNYIGERVAWISSDTKGGKLDLSTGKIVFVIHNFPIAPGNYNCNLYCEVNNEVADWVSNVLEFTVLEKDYYHTGRSVPANQGNILLNYKIQ